MADQPERPLRPWAEAERLFAKTSLNFVISVISSVPVIDDPDCSLRRPGYPTSYTVPFNQGYPLSICLRDDFVDGFDWEGPEEGYFETESYEDFSRTRQWMANLFEILAGRWGWLPIYERYPVLFPDSATELEMLLKMWDDESDPFEDLGELPQDFELSRVLDAPKDDEPLSRVHWESVFTVTHWMVSRLEEVGGECLRPSITIHEKLALLEIEGRFSDYLGLTFDAAPEAAETPDTEGQRVGTARRAKRERRFKRGHLDDMALSVAALHPDWTNQQIADHLGCNVKTLSDRDRYPKFNRQRDRQRQSRGSLRGGHYDARTGRYDQVSEGDT